MKTIYNTYVVMESQEQCDRLQNLCISNNLKIEHDFKMFNPIWNIFEYCDTYYCFGIWTSNDNKFEVTEQEFIELLNQKL